jgi:D-amino-acid dehydrogenase
VISSAAAFAGGSVAGHGTLGWTMACGSGRVLADLMSERKPDIDVSELTVSRYEQRFG